MNGLFVFACAVPISAIIVRVFPSDWVMVAVAAGLLASAGVLWPTIYNLDTLIDSGINLPSLALDFVKYALSPLIMSALIRKAMPSSKELHLQS